MATACWDRCVVRSALAFFAMLALSTTPHGTCSNRKKRCAGGNGAVPRLTGTTTTLVSGAVNETDSAAVPQGPGTPEDSANADCNRYVSKGARQEITAFVTLVVAIDRNTPKLQFSCTAPVTPGASAAATRM